MARYHYQTHRDAERKYPHRVGKAVALVKQLRPNLHHGFAYDPE